MNQILLIGQMIVGALLITSILMQSKGSGLSAVFGGGGSSYRSKRGVEKLLHRGTIFLAGVFVLLAIGNLILPK